MKNVMREEMSIWKKLGILFGGIVVIWLTVSVIVTIADGLNSMSKEQSPSHQAKKPLTAEQMSALMTPDSLYNAINETRVANNLPPYSRNPDLDKSAKLKCDDMVAGNYYEHNNPVTDKAGGSYVDDVGVRAEWISENLNQGVFSSSKEVIDSWMGSEAHRASIIDPKFTEIGFATCILSDYPDQLTVVQHKIEPVEEQQVQNNYYQQPQRRIQNTYCTHNDYTYFSDTTTCTTY